jgi:uncharacterized protein YqgC (DUF456 family)
VAGPWLQVLMALVLVGGLLVVPFGLPGVWIMVAALFGSVLAGWVGWPVWLALATLALLSEALEFVVVKRMGDRYGGTSGAFWGAVVGGFAGVVIGAPVPVVGSLVAGFLGTFLGAAALTFHRTRSVRDASRVGWGVLLARILAVGLKVGVGVAILVVGIAALFLD